MLLKERMEKAIAKYRNDNDWEELKPVLEVLVDSLLGQKRFSGQYGGPELARQNAIDELTRFFGNPEWLEYRNVFGHVIKIINGVAKIKNPVLFSFDALKVKPSSEDEMSNENEEGPAPSELTWDEADDIAQNFYNLKPAALAREGGPWDYMRLKSTDNSLWILLGIYGKARKASPQNENEILDEFALFCHAVGKKKKRTVVFSSVKTYQDATARNLIRGYMDLSNPRLAKMIFDKWGYKYQPRQIADFKMQEREKEKPSIEDDFEGRKNISENYALLVKRRRGK
jgi:hypothetical protein